MDKEYQLQFSRIESEARENIAEATEKFEKSVCELKKRFLQYPPSLIPAILESLDIETIIISYGDIRRCKSIYFAEFDEESRTVTISKNID